MNAKVTVLYLNPAGYIGGAERSLIDLIAALPPDRFRPLVVSLGYGPLREEVEKLGAGWEEVPLPPALAGLSRGRGMNSPGSLLAAPFLSAGVVARLLRIVRSRNVGLIHTNGIKAHLLGSFLAPLSGRKLVWHFRDLVDEGIQLRLLRGVARLVPQRIIANSRAVKKRLGDGGKIKVVYNAVAADLRAAPPAGGLRREWGPGPEEIVVGTVGHFAPLKGYDDFVQAVPSVLEKIPGARFVIVGEALYPAYQNYKRHIVDVVGKLGLSDRICFAGPRNDLGEVLHAFDIFVLPSRSEGFGRANLEAMAAGKPVVSTRVGGIPEVVLDGKTGILVSPRDPAALAAAITRLARDRHLRNQMGEAGRERAALFSIERMVEGVLEVYEEVLSESAGRSDDAGGG